MKTLLITGGIVMLLMAGAIGYLYPKQEVEQPIGSVNRANEYHATTTPENGSWTDQLIQTGTGALGSVVITTAGNLEFDLLNATTTDITKRTDNTATSTILLATFPASMVAGTYTFDVVFWDGLYLDVKSGTLGSSTITHR